MLQRFLCNAAILFLVHALAHNRHYTVARYSLLRAAMATIVPFQPAKTMTRHFVPTEGARITNSLRTPGVETRKGEGHCEEKCPYHPIHTEGRRPRRCVRRRKHTCVHKRSRKSSRRQECIDLSRSKSRLRIASRKSG